MQRKTEKSDLYSGADLSFNDIVIGGKLGGRKGLKSYLRSRTNQLTRELKGVGRDKQQKERILLAISAMSDGIKIIDEMSGGASTAK